MKLDSLPSLDSNLNRSIPDRVTLREKRSKYGVFSGPNTGKYGPEKPPYLDTFHAVWGCQRDAKKYNILENCLENLNNRMWI